MENLIKALYIVSIVAAMQGCTTHNYYTQPESIGIASTTHKGTTGTIGTPGMAGAGLAKEQRKQELSELQAQNISKQGPLGATGTTQALGNSGLNRAPASRQAQPPKPFGPEFFEKAALKVLEWCVLLRCGS